MHTTDHAHTTTYAITLSGHLEAGWSSRFEGMRLTSLTDVLGRPVTVLTGVVPDQAALHGLIAKIRGPRVNAYLDHHNR